MKKILYTMKKYSLNVIALIILIIEWYKGGFKSAVVLFVVYIFGIFIASLLKK